MGLDVSTGQFRERLTATPTANRTVTFPDEDTDFGSAWTAWTPTVSGAVSVIGTTSFAGAYKKIGKVVSIRMIITFAGATFTAGTMTITLPVTGVAGHNAGPIGVAEFVDTGTTQNMGWLLQESTTTGTFRVAVAGSARVTNLVPHTWANTDVIRLNGTYEAA